MKTYLLGEEIISRYEIEQFELYRLVEQGLIPRDQRSGQPIKTLSADNAQLWLCNLELKVIKRRSEKFYRTFRCILNISPPLSS